MTVFSVLAMATPPAGGAQGGGSPLQMFLPMIIIFGIFYFMMIRPQQRKEKERKAMINAVKTGDRVLFAGGLLGTVTNVKDQILVVKVADGVKIEIVRSSVSKVLEKDEKGGEQE